MSAAALIGVLAAYVSGSFPSAYLAGRMVKGIDLRTIGSGNLGTTNVYRELGLVPALAVLVLDALKGALPVAFLPGLLGLASRADSWYPLAFGIAAIGGHAKPIFLLWKGGGKGVATAAGVFVAVTPIPALATIGVFVIAVAVTRFVSLGSIVAAIALPIAEWFVVGAAPPFYASAAIGLFVAWRHRTNVGRLLAGTEPKLGRSKAAAS